jgi:hypothetical protein
MLIELIILKIGITIDFIEQDQSNVCELSKMLSDGLFGMIFEPGNGMALHNRSLCEETTLPIEVRKEPSPKQTGRI